MSDMHGAVDFFALNVAAEHASSIVMLVPPDRTTALAPLVLRNVRVTSSRNIRVVRPLCTNTELGEQHLVGALQDLRLRGHCSRTTSHLLVGFDVLSRV